MANALFSFAPFDLDGVQDGYSFLEGCEKEEVVMKGKEDHLLGIEDWGEVDSLCSEYGTYQEAVAEKGINFSKNQQHQQQQPHSSSDIWMSDNFHFFPPIQSTQESTKLEKIKREKPYPVSLASLELLSNYGSGFKKMKGEKSTELNNEISLDVRKLSTEEIIRVAGARYIQFCTQGNGDVSLFRHPYGCALSGLSEEEIKDVELVHLLLAAAEKVGYQQFDRASKLLSRCEWIASKTGNPTQRVVFYFSEALRERIDRETGGMASKGLQGKRRHEITDGLSYSLTSVAFHLELPFSQATLFTEVQAILETVASASKVHLIDLSLRCGVQWVVLMQALAERDECPVELTITAVGTRDKQKLEETGRRLESFAKTISYHFSFKVVFVSDMQDLKDELFEIQADEAVAVYARWVLKTMISRPKCLEILMRVIRKLSPSIMVVTEVEAKHNSISFANRFIEALFFYGAYFDCVEDCMNRDNQYRMIAEALYFGEGIRNIVATEGKERTVRNVKIDVWRAFFARFGMVEIEFSESSLYQASLAVKKIDCWSSCTLENNGKCLIVGWKGTPIQSVSAWKFC